MCRLCHDEKHYSLITCAYTMEVFDGKKAATEYMATHTLAFSTPELTLMRFAFWLGDTVPNPSDKDKAMPRMLTLCAHRSCKE